MVDRSHVSVKMSQGSGVIWKKNVGPVYMIRAARRDGTVSEIALASKHFCGTGAGAREIRPAKKLCYFVFFSRVRDAKFLLVKI